MHRLIRTLLLLLLAGIAQAHLGNENNTEVRVYADRMQMVVRTSIPFAWKLMGNQAPVMADEAGRASARSGLIAAAPGLFTVSAGGKPMTPTKVDCVFEVENDVAFVLTFSRPAEWPVTVKANFFEELTNLDSGTVTVFDFTTSRFNSDLKPVTEGVIHQRSPEITFFLGAAALQIASEAASKPEVPVSSLPQKDRSWVTLVIGLSGILAMILVLKWLRRRLRR